jgi:hypothetical protein
MWVAMRRYVMAAVACVAGAATVRAQGLPDVPTATVLTEVMMDAQSSEALLYGALLGVSPSSTQDLFGTSLTNVSAASFSFSLDPGSTYVGRPISDSVQGHFDPATGSYLWSASGSWNDPVLWSISGAIIPKELDPLKPTWQLDSVELVEIRGLPKIGNLDIPDKVTLFSTGKPGLTISAKRSNVQNPVGNPLGVTFGSDTWDAVRQAYIFQDRFTPEFQGQFAPFKTGTMGTSPFVGGPGTYTTTISSVPEPSSRVLGLLGALGLLGSGWRTRKPAGAS